jgi:hypothetical protein
VRELQLLQLSAEEQPARPRVLLARALMEQRLSVSPQWTLQG